MSKHTPGPWRIGDAGNTVFGPPNGNPSPEIISFGGGNKANIRLIAAAPELLEALKGLMEYATLTLPHKGEWCKQVSNSKTAIAKAEGKE